LNAIQFQTAEKWNPEKDRLIQKGKKEALIERKISVIIIISLLMSPMLGHRPSLWNTHKESGPLPTTRAQCGLVGVNDCKYAGTNGFNVPSEARRS
jgi:hypothetical protein